MTVQIEELTPKQVKMCHVMWNLDTKEDFSHWYNCILNDNGRQQADILEHLIILAAVEEMVDNADAQCPDVKDILKEFML